MVKYVVKCLVKLKNCWIGTKIGVVVDMDHSDYDSGDKKTKRKKKTKKD